SSGGNIICEEQCITNALLVELSLAFESRGQESETVELLATTPADYFNSCSAPCLNTRCWGLYSGRASSLHQTYIRIQVELLVTTPADSIALFGFQYSILRSDFRGSISRVGMDNATCHPIEEDWCSITLLSYRINKGLVLFYSITSRVASEDLTVGRATTTKLVHRDSTPGEIVDGDPTDYENYADKAESALANAIGLTILMQAKLHALTAMTHTPPIQSISAQDITNATSPRIKNDSGETFPETSLKPQNKRSNRSNKNGSRAVNLTQSNVLTTGSIDPPELSTFHINSEERKHKLWRALLPTGQITVMDHQTRALSRVNVLLDTEAEIPFIDSSLADRLHLPVLEETSILINTFGSRENKRCNSKRVGLDVWDNEGILHSLELSTHDGLTCPLTSPTVSVEDMEFVKLLNLPLAIVGEDLLIQPLILLGCDHLWSFVRCDIPSIELPSGLHILPTNSAPKKKRVSAAPPSSLLLSLDKRKSTEYSISTIINVHADLRKNEQEQLAQHVIGLVEESENKGDRHVHYIPHHPVITPRKTATKLRLVFDASSHYKGCPLLNDVLTRGPVILTLLYGILLRFWVGQIAITSDTEKAFLQVRLQERNRDVTHCLWL
ncbi:hypothetical protein OSTOST_01991, partial [Ostertagia ostertagi]